MSSASSAVLSFEGTLRCVDEDSGIRSSIVAWSDNYTIKGLTWTEQSLTRGSFTETYGGKVSGGSSYLRGNVFYSGSGSSTLQASLTFKGGKLQDRAREPEGFAVGRFLDCMLWKRI